MAEPATTLADLAAQSDDETWLELLEEASVGAVVRGVRFPSPPDPTLQSNFVGMSGKAALRDAFTFYKFVKATYAELAGYPLDSSVRVLDFGCGWGRFLLLFMKDIAPWNLFGVDVDSDVIGFCKVSGMPAKLATVPPYGPTQFADGSLDLVYAYSVFSHLAEPAHLAWIHEFKRILRPGGVLVFTTEGRPFLDFVRGLRDKPAETLGPWEKTLLDQFHALDTAEAEYAAGKFVYVASGGGDYRPATFYGEALVPKEYIERAYPAGLELRAFISDPARFGQTVIVLQRQEVP